jgi:hypothetical protein
VAEAVVAGWHTYGADLKLTPSGACRLGLLRLQPRSLASVSFQCVTHPCLNLMLGTGGLFDISDAAISDIALYQRAELPPCMAVPYESTLLSDFLYIR